MPQQHPQKDRSPSHTADGAIQIPCFVLFAPDTDRCFLAQLLGGMKAYELVHVMTNAILNRNNWTQSTSRSRDVKRPSKPLRHDTLTVFVGWTQGAGEDTARVVASFFGWWTNWHAEPHMWSDAGCSYASVRYQHATALALAAGQYVGGRANFIWQEGGLPTPPRLEGCVCFYRGGGFGVGWDGIP